MYKEKLNKMLMIARKKHPVFAEGDFHGLGVIFEEYKELEKACQSETIERRRAEAMDVAVTAIRFWLGEHIADPDKRREWMEHNEKESVV
jgi:hypothetical protein